MRIARFLTWTCLALALASTSLAQTAPAAPPAPGTAPAAPPAAAPAPAPSAVTPVTADPYSTPAPTAAPGAPAAAPAPAPAPATAPAPAPASAPAPTFQTQPAPAPAPAPYAQPAPAPQPQPAAPTYQESEEPEAEDKGKCALGTFCFGPVLSLGLPNPLGIGVHGRISEHFGFGLDYQWLPSIGVGDVDVGISLFTLTGRWHPGGSAFFLGAGFSYQSLYAEGSVVDPSGTSSDIPIDASVGIPQFMLGLGVLGGNGFVMGIDLAFGIPLGSAAVEFEGEMPDPDDNPTLAATYEQQKEDIEDFAEIALEILPATFQLNLIRIGYIF